MTGLALGLVVTALLLGLRHGIDWDHIVAITDIAAAEEGRRRGIVLGTLYALGHASVVFALGVAAIALGRTVPDWVDAVMGRVVGITLIVLGLIVATTMIVERGRFRARSRWMILFSWLRRVRRAAARLLGRTGSVRHAHPHVAVAGTHHGGEDGSRRTADPPLGAPVHVHEHEHEELGHGGAFGIGMLHGVGAETPSQVLIFLAAASAGGTFEGIAVLAAFVVGLVLANTAIVLAAVFGFATASRRPRVQFALGGLTVAASLGIGTLFLLGQDSLLPAIFAG